MVDNQAYISRIERQISEWRDQLDTLRDKADKADAQEKVQKSKTMEHLRSLVEDVEKKVHEARLATERSTDKLKADIEEMVQETREEFKRA